MPLGILLNADEDKSKDAVVVCDPPGDKALTLSSPKKISPVEIVGFVER